MNINVLKEFFKKKNIKNIYVLLPSVFLSTFSFFGYTWSPWLLICIAGFQPSLRSFSFIGCLSPEKGHREKKRKSPNQKKKKKNQKRKFLVRSNHTDLRALLLRLLQLSLPSSSSIITINLLKRKRSEPYQKNKKPFCPEV